MSSEVDNSRRRFLTAGTVVVGAVGTVAVAIPFVKSWSPSARARSAGAPVEANIGKLLPGQLIIVKWRGKPVWIVRRDEKALATLSGAVGNKGIRLPLLAKTRRWSMSRHKANIVTERP